MFLRRLDRIPGTKLLKWAPVALVGKSPTAKDDCMRSHVREDCLRDGLGLRALDTPTLLHGHEHVDEELDNVFRKQRT